MWLDQIKFPSKFYRNLVIILLALGILFRFYNIDRKVYWYDETMTSVRVSGHTAEELEKQVYDGTVISVENLLQTYQYPNNTRDLKDTFDALKAHPEHSPLYFLIARFWLQIFGNSVTTIRLLSVLISLLAIPSVYWLCRELFGLPLTASLAAAIIAISPFHVLYAQEARAYSLWTVTILLSCATLLRAMRLKTWRSWGIYELTAALALYTHIFSAFVLIGHGIYVGVTQQFRWNKQTKAYLLASALGVALFTPWLIIVVNHFSQLVENTESVTESRKGFLPLFWGLNLSRIFFDLNQGTSPFSPLHYLSAALAGYALYYLYRQAPQPAWVFIVTLIGVLGTALIAPDVLTGGRRSTITRYAIPCYLGIQIAVAYLLSNKLIVNSDNSKRLKRWRYVAIALAFSGIISCAVSAHIPVWWHKSQSKSRYNPQIASIINTIEQPLLISDEIPGRVLSLAHLLEPTVYLQLLKDSDPPEIPEQFRNIYLYRPSEELQQAMEQKSNLELERVEEWLWKVGS